MNHLPNDRAAFQAVRRLVVLIDDPVGPAALPLLYILELRLAFELVAEQDREVELPLVAAVQGGTQALRRSLFSSMIPRARSAELFGYYALFEKVSGLVGPALFGMLALPAGSSRTAILSVLGFFIVGAALLSRTNVVRGRAHAELAKMGADSVSVNLGACPYPRRILGLITQLGMRAGLAFNPATPIPPLDFCLPHLAFLLVLSTEPEAGDCPFLPAMLSKVTQGKQQPGMGKLEWVMDGGITSENIKKVVDAGVETVVVGRGIFSNNHYKYNILKLKQACDSL